ncbi:MAG: extracellular solute-binding protein, partial [Alphaproteobacteria bacterium]|nr:extracellular solute-binding protein [Alphaproteobacteria bacterium]
MKLAAILFAAVMINIGLSSPLLAEPIELVVDTAFPEYLNTYKKIVSQFTEKHPDIKITLTTPAVNYDELFQRTTRDVMTKTGADVSFQSYNFVDPLVARDVPVSLDRFIAAESNWAALGYLPNITDMARSGGNVVGIPFNTSIPFIYYNASLARKAGADLANTPKSWAEIASLAKTIASSSGAGSGIYFDYYYIVANLTFDALIEAGGGRMMSDDRRRLTFDGPTGVAALDTLRLIGASGMVDTTRDQALQSFSAGTLGIYVSTSSNIKDFGRMARAVGFELACAAFPMTAANGRYPAGGNAAMMMTRDPAKQQAAWEFIKFATGGAGQLVVAQTTGYIPSNTRALEDDSFKKVVESDSCYRTAVGQLSHVAGPFTFPGPNAQKISNALRERLREV